MKKFWMHWRVTGALAAVLVACGAYWWLLLAQQQEQTTFAETQTELRATHIARTLAAQMETLMGGLEYLARSLAVLHEHDPQHTFQLAATDALASFPPGSILQIAVTDSSGRIVYSSLSPDSATLGTSIGDRPHFQAHTLETEKRLYISRPTLGRVSGQWSVQVSYPISQGNRFGGVVVLSINPDYLSNNLRDVFTQGNDAALLLRADGAYLARSHGQKEAMALNVPADREFMRYPERTSGRYQVAAPIEDVHRFYAWQRLAHYPLASASGSAATRPWRERTNPCATAACAMPWERWRLCWRRAGLPCSSNVKSRTMPGWSATGNVTVWHWKGASWAHGTGAHLQEISFLTAVGCVCWGCRSRPTTPARNSCRR